MGKPKKRRRRSRPIGERPSVDIPEAAHLATTEETTLYPGVQGPLTERLEQRLKAAEEVFATHLKLYSAETALAEVLDVARPTARKYLRAIRRIYAIEARNEDREETRAKIRAALYEVHERCLAAGTTQGLNVAVRALEKLADLDGLREADLSTQPRVTIQAADGAQVNVVELSEQARQVRAERRGRLIDVRGEKTQRKALPESGIDAGSGGADGGSGDGLP